MIQIQQHDDAGFGVEAGKGDEAHPYGVAEIVAKDVQEPKRSHQGEWHSQNDNKGFDDRTSVQIEQNADDQQGERKQEQKALERALLIFELTRPLHVVAGRELNRLADTLGRGLYISTNIVGRNIHEHKTNKLPIFVTD